MVVLIVIDRTAGGGDYSCAAYVGEEGLIVVTVGCTSGDNRRSGGGNKPSIN